MAYYSRHKRRTKDPVSLWIVAVFLVVAVFVTLPSARQFISNTFSSSTFIFGIAIVVFGCILLFFLTNRELERIHARKLADIDNMDGVAFEHYVGELLKFQGFKIEFTPRSGDYGVDIVAKLGDQKIAVQLKRYKSAVGREAISDAVAGMKYYRCDKCMVVTNSHFTPNAKVLAKANNCELVDRSLLTDWILAFSKKQKFSGVFDHGQHASKDEDMEEADSELMTDAQFNYLHDLSKKAGEVMDEKLTRVQASRRIDELKSKLGKD